MFSIPVAGLAKAAIAVTISLHPAAAHQAHQAPDHYTVKSGDTLSSIARQRQRDRLARAVVGQPAPGEQPGDDSGGPAAHAELLAPAQGLAEPGRPGRRPGARPT